VKARTLDDCVGEHGCRPDLIKIDTEGAEVRVLEGAMRTLKHDGPVVIFESLRGSDRGGIARLFADADYLVCRLPLPPDGRPTVLRSAQFAAHRMKNFLAVPRARLDTGNGGLW
jgi:hypothetical protein